MQGKLTTQINKGGEIDYVILFLLKNGTLEGGWLLCYVRVNIDCINLPCIFEGFFIPH